MIAELDWIAQSLAKKYRNSTIDSEDILQEARLGIIYAVRDWPNKPHKAKLSTFAYHYAKNRIVDLLRKQNLYNKHETKAGTAADMERLYLRRLDRKLKKLYGGDKAKRLNEP